MGGVADLANMMCSLFGESVEQALKNQAKAAAKNIKSGLPLAERKQIKMDLLAKRKKIEIDEEALISKAEELGLMGFYRRYDCNPEIVLMMEEDKVNA